jgi:beta-galactosidase
VEFLQLREWCSGGFVWTGFDYRGEPSPYDWPNISSQYGIIDTCGFSKDTVFYYQSWWTNKPVLHLFPHWNWPGMEGKEIAVWVYSNLDKVELLFNGQSLGAKDMKKDSHGAWVVKYASVCAKSPTHSSTNEIKASCQIVACPSIWFRARLSFGSQFSP